jgi:hypothetical protein
MNLDVPGAMAIFVGLVLLLDIAALRWGVDSRFIDVRSDF